MATSGVFIKEDLRTGTGTATDTNGREELESTVEELGLPLWKDVVDRVDGIATGDGIARRISQSVWSILKVPGKTLIGTIAPGRPSGRLERGYGRILASSHGGQGLPTFDQFRRDTRSWKHDGFPTW